MIAVTLAGVLLVQTPAAAEPPVEKPPVTLRFGEPRAIGGRTLAERLGVNVTAGDLNPAMLAAIRGAGFRFVRFPLEWAQLERKPGSHDLTAVGAALDACAAADLRPLLVFDATHPLIAPGRAASGNSAIIALTRALAEVTRRHAGRGLIFEFSATPLDAADRSRDASPETTAAILAAAARAIRQVDPEAKLVGPCVNSFPRGIVYSYSAPPALLALDGFSVRSRPYGTPELLAADLEAAGGTIVERRAEHGEGTPPALVLTDCAPRLPTGEMAASEHDRAALLVRMLIEAVAAQARLVVWARWRDQLEPGGDASFGVIGPGAHTGATRRALRTLVAVLGDAEFAGRLPAAEPGDETLVFKKGDELRLVGWTTGVPRFVPVAGVEGDTSHLQSIDFLGGAPKDLGNRLFLGREPTYVVLRAGSEG